MKTLQVITNIMFIVALLGIAFTLHTYDYDTLQICGVLYFVIICILGLIINNREI